MTTPGKGDHGMGVKVVQLDGTKVVMHDGEIEGFNAFLIYVPARKVAVVVLSNVNGEAPDKMGDRLVKVVLGKARGATKR